MLISKTENRDCLEAMREFPDKFFELAICDVPYGIGESKKVRSRGRGVIQRNGKITPMPPIHEIKDWDSQQPPQEYFDELFRVTKKHIIFGANYLEFSQKNSSSGRIFWDKINGDSDWSDGELLWTNLFPSVRKFSFLWNGFCQGISLLDPLRQRGNKKLNEKRIHPSQKPTALYIWILQNYAKQGDKILDTHLGSGSSRIAAYDLGFDFYGFELDTEYFEAQEKRFANHIAQPKLFEPVNENFKQEVLF